MPSFDSGAGVFGSSVLDLRASNSVTPAVRARWCPVATRGQHLRRGTPARRDP